MKVFGIGLNKTGTTSLGRALEILGYKNHISYNLELVKYWKSNDLEPIIEIARKGNNFEDWPWPLLYKELFYKFHDAKFILTTRKSSEIWFESLCKHSIMTGPTEFRKLIYGYYMPHDFKKEHIAFYRNHNKSVIDFFKQHPSEKLLTVCWEDGDGWKELCPFLNREIPKTDFPLINKYSEKRNKNSTINLLKKWLPFYPSNLFQNKPED